MEFEVTDYISKNVVKVKATNLSSLKKEVNRLFVFDGTDENSLKLFAKHDYMEEIQDDRDLEISNELVALFLKNVPQQFVNAKSALKSCKIDEIMGYIEMTQPESFVNICGYVKNAMKRKTFVSKKSKHPEWFEGLDTKKLQGIEVKEEYMKHLAKSRAENFCKRAVLQLQKKLQRISKTLCPNECEDRRKIIEEFKLEMKRKLKEMDYFQCYFDRKYKASEDSLCRGSFCDSEGLFKCQGKKDSTSGCNTTPKHEINPYESCERRVLFSCWQLDHRKDLKVVVDLVWIDFVHCLKKKRSEEEVMKEAFEDLFTKKNLAIVFKNCHDQIPKYGEEDNDSHP